MPVGDARTPWQAPPRGGGRRKLGSKPVVPADVEVMLNELREEAVAVTARVLLAGGAIMFGGTRDRGSVLVRLLLDGESYEDYVQSVAGLVSAFEAIDLVLEAQKARGATLRP